MMKKLLLSAAIAVTFAAPARAVDAPKEYVGTWCQTKNGFSCVTFYKNAAFYISGDPRYKDLECTIKSVVPKGDIKHDGMGKGPKTAIYLYCPKAPEDGYGPNPNLQALYWQKSKDEIMIGHIDDPKNFLGPYYRKDM
jgi:hypothetical protein